MCAVYLSIKKHALLKFSAFPVAAAGSRLRSVHAQPRSSGWDEIARTQEPDTNIEDSECPPLFHIIELSLNEYLINLE